MITTRLDFYKLRANSYCKVEIFWKNKHIGYCYLSVCKDYVHLDILNINPKLQGMGYGRKFIEFLTDNYNVRGEHTVTSSGFYEKLGAKIK